MEMEEVFVDSIPLLEVIVANGSIEMEREALELDGISAVDIAEDMEKMRNEVLEDLENSFYNKECSGDDS